MTTAQTKRVLVVEDEKPMAKAIELKLIKNGLEALAVFNGAEALAAMEKEKYDLILLDIMMPEMDGWEVMRSMKDRGMKMPVIITSNLSQGEDRQKALALGAVDYLVKSDTSIMSIVEKVKGFLNKL
jgi:DNA-binding response OmpR family regulator